MKSIKKIGCGAFAILLAFSMTACGGNDDSKVDESFDIKNDVEIDMSFVEDMAKDYNVSGTTIKYLGIESPNPTKSKPERSVALSLFEDKFGCKIEYVATSYAEQFNALATNISSDQGIDVFPFNKKGVPSGVVSGQFQPIDSIIDFDSALWSGMKTTAEQFKFNGEIYVAPYGYNFADVQVLMYNYDTLEANGLDDPYELYLEGKWNYEEFYQMMLDYVDANTTDENPHYGIGGWWANAFIANSGETLVQYDGKKFVNNLNSPVIEEAQLFVEKIGKNNLQRAGGWNPPDAVLAANDTLFASMGAWAYNAAALKVPDSRVGVVTLPKSKSSDKYYATHQFASDMWVKGSKNGDAVKAWMACNRVTYTVADYVNATKEKFLANNKGWDEEMYNRIMEFFDPEKFTYIYEYGYGMGSEMSEDSAPPFGHIVNLYESLNRDDTEITNWAQLKETYYNSVEAIINDYNNKLS